MKLTLKEIAAQHPFIIDKIVESVIDQLSDTEGEYTFDLPEDDDTYDILEDDNDNEPELSSVGEI